ncbi:MAG: glycosyltransferase [Bacilli bacterium]|nr:glycosyltransferase [Bacilli bacterium]
MIFVILGTQDKSFDRLLKYIDDAIKNKIINQKVIVQAGSSKYKSENIKTFDLISANDFKEYINKSDYIITHGGVGSILDSIKQNKKVIAVPRLSKYNEHENDHQLQIVEKFDELGYIIGCYDLNDLNDKINLLNTFIPKKYQKNNDKMINLIQNYIDNI